MIRLDFKNPVFHPGLNYTVRLGTKYQKNLEIGKVLILGCKAKDLIIGVSEVSKIIVCRFQSLSPEVFMHEHDPACRNPSILLKELCRVYDKRIDPTDVVTAIGFVINHGVKP